MKAPFILGGLLFGGYFIYNGINHFLHAKQMADAKNLAQPELAVSATGAALVLGGTSILLGINPTFGRRGPCRISSGRVSDHA
jgi:putative oxidoreductase